MADELRKVTRDQARSAIQKMMDDGADESVIKEVMSRVQVVDEAPAPSVTPKPGELNRVDTNMVGVDHDRIVRGAADFATRHLPPSVAPYGAEALTLLADVPASVIEAFSAPEAVATGAQGRIPNRIPAVSVGRTPAAAAAKAGAKTGVLGVVDDIPIVRKLRPAYDAAREAYTAAKNPSPEGFDPHMPNVSSVPDRGVNMPLPSHGPLLERYAPNTSGVPDRGVERPLPSHGPVVEQYAPNTGGHPVVRVAPNSPIKANGQPAATPPSVPTPDQALQRAGAVGTYGANMPDIMQPGVMSHEAREALGMSERPVIKVAPSKEFTQGTSVPEAPLVNRPTGFDKFKKEMEQWVPKSRSKTREGHWSQNDLSKLEELYNRVQGRTLTNQDRTSMAEQVVAHRGTRQADHVATHYMNQTPNED